MSDRIVGWNCDRTGCARTKNDGPLVRVNPKGERGVFMCEEHAAERAQVTVPAVVIASFDELLDHLTHLNFDGVADTAIVLDRDSFAWLAYCTDPDADWYIECGDPHARFRYEEGENWYEPVSLEWIKKRGPYRVLAEYAR